MTNKRYTRNCEGCARSTGTQKLGVSRTVRKARWLCLTAAVLALAGMSGDGQAEAAANWTVGQRLVTDAALKSTVPPELALAVAQVSREERLGGEAAPRAVGIMQVLPSLARQELGLKPYGIGETRANAGVGVALLERLNRRYDGRWDLTLSHYRGGPLPRCKEGPVMHEHTLGYVAAVMDWWVRYQKEPWVAALIEETQRHGFPERKVASRFHRSGGTLQHDVRDHGWRPFRKRWHYTWEDGHSGSVEGRGQFRLEDGPACDGTWWRRFFGSERYCLPG